MGATVHGPGDWARSKRLFFSESVHNVPLPKFATRRVGVYVRSITVTRQSWVFCCCRCWNYHNDSGRSKRSVLMLVARA